MNKFSLTKKSKSEKGTTKLLMSNYGKVTCQANFSGFYFFVDYHLNACTLKQSIDFIFILLYIFSVVGQSEINHIHTIYGRLNINPYVSTSTYVCSCIRPV